MLSDVAVWTALHNGNTQPFYSSKPWRRARHCAVVRAGFRCDRNQGGCGKPVGVPGERALVDHIKPLREFPHLALEENNLRVLCWRCHNQRHARRDWQAAQGADINGWPVGPTHPWNTT